MIAIIDYGLGNLFSIHNMLKHIHVDSVITDDEETITGADKLILPGVGKYDEGVRNLQAKGLDRLIIDEAHNGKPILGICLGMQLMGNSSEEGSLEGLKLIDFKSIRFCFDDNKDLKAPHMGWQNVRFTDEECPLNKGLDDKQRYYFVHSYYAVCNLQENVMAFCDYGFKFAAAVRNGNIYGVQFHPEKSHRYGMQLLMNFTEKC